MGSTKKEALTLVTDAPVAATGRQLSARTLTVLTSTILDELTLHARQWNSLVEHSPSQLPMSSFAYVYPFLSHQLPPDTPWRVLFAYDGSNLVGVLPLVADVRNRFGLERTCFRAPHNMHITSVTAYARIGFENLVIPAFQRELARSTPQYFSLHFDEMHERSAFFRTELGALEGVRIAKELSGNGSYLPIIGDYDSYKQSLSSNHRRNLKRFASRLSKSSSVTYRFLTGEQVSDEAAEAFFELEASGWKGTQGSAILSCPKRAEFYRALVRHLREAGWLELHLLYADGKPIAGHFGMRMARSLVLWKIAYDERYAACGPGNLLFEKTVERTFLQRDVEEINCMTDMVWHRSWNMASRPYYNLTIYPNRFVSFALGAMPAQAGRILRSVPGMRPLVQAIRAILSF